MCQSRIALCIIILFYAGTGAFSQKNQIDSLEVILNRTQEDTSKVNILLALHQAIKYKNPSQATVHLTNALLLSDQINYRKGMLRALLVQGEFLKTRSKDDSALLVYQKAQSLADELSDKQATTEALLGQGFASINLQNLAAADSLAAVAFDIAKSDPIDSLSIAEYYRILSGIAYYKTQYAKSIEYDQNSLKFNQTDLNSRAKAIMNIGVTHTAMRDYNKATDYSLEALELAQRANDAYSIAQIHNQLGKVKYFQKEYQSAKEYYRLALVHFQQIDDLDNISHIHYNLAEIHVELKEFGQGIREFKNALKINEQTNAPLGKAHITYRLGLTYHKMGDFKNAEEYYLKAKPLFEELNIPNMNIYVAKRLSDLYAGVGDYKNGYDYLLKFKLLNDSIFNVKTMKQFAEVEEKYQSEQRQKEIALLSAENQIASLELEKQENLRNYLLVGACLLLAMVGLVYNRYQVKARSNAKLKELDAIKTNFFTNISHEFRTPLTLILSPIQRLLQSSDNQSTREDLKVIHRNATVLAQLTNQLLDLSKLEAGKLDLQVTKGDFKSFIRVLCASYESLADAQKVQFTSEVDHAPASAYYDEDKVQKILNNLLSNAFKFTSIGGKVILRVHLEENQIAVSVSDTGKGISKADQELVFQRFYQNVNQQPHATGTGVGLTLTKELANLHRGDILLESELGTGSTFTFLFPSTKAAYKTSEIFEEVQISQNAAPEISPVYSNGVEEQAGLSEKIILIVEDNPDLRNHLRSLLNSDYQIIEAIDGKEGIEKAISLVPDMIISDLMMPEVDGVELSHTLKRDEKTSHIPIILLTAKADRHTKLDGLKTGADDFLTKPFDNEELLVRIENLLSQRQNLQEKYTQTLRLAPSKIEIESPEEVFIKRALDTVDNHLSNAEFTVEAFQKEMGMSRMQLHRKLKALTNFSASEFIRDIRLQRAADLLKTKGINVSEVAYSCGFNSVSYFTQCYKQRFGKSPSEFLKIGEQLQ
ncbi:MAG: response regulator [Bacteroidota bacterium]